MTEFNLSDKIFSCDLTNEAIGADSVKEFIRLLKEKVDKYSNYEDEVDTLIMTKRDIWNEINSLAGDKLK